MLLDKIASYKIHLEMEYEVQHPEIIALRYRLRELENYALERDMSGVFNCPPTWNLSKKTLTDEEKKNKKETLEQIQQYEKNKEKYVNETMVKNGWYTNWFELSEKLQDEYRPCELKMQQCNYFCKDYYSCPYKG